MEPSTLIFRKSELGRFHRASLLQPKNLETRGDETCVGPTHQFTVLIQSNQIIYFSFLLSITIPSLATQRIHKSHIIEAHCWTTSWAELGRQPNNNTPTGLEFLPQRVQL
ncbi:Uncharacterized protein TCM_000476 [Theobroma cacao]|uniref:Uncharacterized protein n=1 Tax=Theobroma cacao TaxID=3641 RepID=A0A061DFZ1_THECC|nr:Uncharacterized protein TCM_000476 [Theobroma cacao]